MGAENEGRYDKEAVRGAMAWMEFLCGRYHIELSGVRPRKGRCPFHAERTASFTVNAEAGTAHCFGCGWHGDEFAFFAALEGLDLRAQFGEVLKRMAGLCGMGPMPENWKPKERKRIELPPPAQKVIRWPRLLRLSDATCEELAALRGLDAASVRAACDAGLVWGCMVGVLAKPHPGERGRVYGEEAVRAKESRLEELVRSWVVYDGAEKVMQFRRLDGEKWKTYNRETRQKEPAFKSDTLGNSKWPMGANLIGGRRCVALVEGAPDMLAAYRFLRTAGRLQDVAVVEAISASVRLHPDALPFFEGKRVRIFAHMDKEDGKGRRAGWEAAGKWETELTEAGGEVDTWDFSDLRRADGEPVGDLNDAACGDEECLKEMAPAMNFEPSCFDSDAQ